MDKANNQQRSVTVRVNKSDASNRMMRSKVAVELHLLPHDVLRDILSRLSLKQAVRMSLLSREWRRLRICPPDLVFTEETLFGSNTTTITDPESMAAEFLESMNSEFITRVDNVLRASCSTSTMITASTVNKFVVKYGLGIYHKNHIDRWIDFSTASMAKHIGLDLRGDGFAGGKYVVPLRKLSGPNGSCVKSLDLAYVCVNLPASFRGITNLNKLSLNMVSMDTHDLER
ncbi:F-box/FBD/LRR-repeat protein At1g13570-like [Triticum aestivum]|nr:F-box/FBD/LRR-repeat protein At1g13570-like [Triticum aestivum]